MKRILIVDDDEDNLEILSKELTSSGYEISVAQDGPTAIFQAKVIKPQLIILDILIPKINGVEVSQHLKQDPTTKDIPIIFLTMLRRRDDPSYIPESAVGAHLVLAKPIDLKELNYHVNHLLNKESGS